MDDLGLTPFSAENRLDLLEVLEALHISPLMWSSTLMDDLGLTPFSAENRLDLLEVLEDRHGVRSTVVTSQPRRQVA